MCLQIPPLTRLSYHDRAHIDFPAFMHMHHVTQLSSTLKKKIQLLVTKAKKRKEVRVFCDFIHNKDYTLYITFGQQITDMDDLILGLVSDWSSD